MIKKTRNRGVGGGYRFWRGNEDENRNRVRAKAKARTNFLRAVSSLLTGTSIEICSNE